MHGPSERVFTFNQQLNTTAVLAAKVSKSFSSEVNSSSYQKQFWSMPKEFILKDTKPEINSKCTKEEFQTLLG